MSLSVRALVAARELMSYLRARRSPPMDWIDVLKGVLSDELEMPEVSLPGVRALVGGSLTSPLHCS